MDPRTPRLTTCFDDLAEAMRAWAKGLFTAEAAVELLIAHRSWLYREDFLEIAVEFGQEITCGAGMAAVDFEAAARALEAGLLPCSDGEGQVLRIAASIAEGVPVDLREAATGMDENNAVLAAAAVCMRLAAGIGTCPRAVSGGEHGHRGHADPAAASLRGPAAAGAGQHAPARRDGAAGGAAGRVQAADPGGLDRPGVPAGRGWQ